MLYSAEIISPFFCIDFESCYHNFLFGKLSSKCSHNSAFTTICRNLLVTSLIWAVMFPKWDLFHFFNCLLVSLSFWSQWRRVILELRDLKPLEKPVCKWGVLITLLQSNIIFFKNWGFWTDLLLGHHDLKLIWGDLEPVCVGTYPAMSHWWRPCLVAPWLSDHCIVCCTKCLGFWGGSSYKMRGTLVHDSLF